MSAASDSPRSARDVVITDCDHGDVGPESRVLGEAGFSVRLGGCKTAADVVEEARGADALINQYAPVDDTVLGALERCRVVVRYGVGVDTVDVEAATRRGVWVVNVPDYGTEEVSDHAVALLLNLARGVGRLDRAVRHGEWDYAAVRPLRRIGTLTVGVVGCGRIGTAFARKAGCLGIRLLGHDAARAPEDLERDGIEPAELDEVLARSDAVSLHAPLTEETRHLIGAEQLRRMKSGAYLINTSRGGLVDSSALLRALEEGEISGAALDVLEDEPPGEGDALVAHERVITTPHAAWYSEESMESLKTEVAREVVRVLSGRRPRSPVNEPAERSLHG